MGDKVTLVRPDGSTFEADREDAEQYKALGYQHETPVANVERNIEQAREDYYTGTGQRTVAGLEGFINGLTVGGYTSLLGGGEEEQARAQYNPGTRLGGEIVGAILPSIIPGGAEVEGARIAKLGASLLEHTPSGLLARGAEAAAEAGTATKVGHSLLRGAVEGAGFGAGGAATEAKLNGDPVTAEAVVAGMGWGALWGGGLGYVAGKIGVSAEKIAAERAAAVEAASKGMIPAENWNAFRSAIEDARKVAGQTVDAAAERVASFAAPVEQTDTLTARIMEHAKELEEAQGALFNRIDVKGGWVKGAPGLRQEIISNQKKIASALERGNYEKYEALANKQVETFRALGDIAKVAAPEVQPFLAKAIAESSSALQGLKGLRAASEGMDAFPFTPDGFAKMTSKKVEKISASVDAFLKDTTPELAPQRDAISRAIDEMGRSAGLDLSEGTASQKIRTAWEALRSSKTKQAAETAAKIQSHGFGTGTLKYVAGHEANKLARDAGMNVIGRGLAREASHKLVAGLLKLAGGAKGMLVDAASKFVVNQNTAKVMKLVGPKVDPLKVRLDGSLEREDMPRKKLMQMRMKEIRDAAPAINDTLYRAVEPIAGSHTELAAAMNKAAVAQFLALSSRVPRDPGTAFNRMQSLWTPDAVMTEKFARAYEVFHNPIGVCMRWLQNPRSITPEGARALRDMNPELWTTLRVEMLDRLAQPGMLDKMSYSEQVSLGQLLDIRIHSTQDPKFIQAQQAMFQKRNEPLPARPSLEGNSNNPSGVASGMTAAQRITEH